MACRQWPGSTTCSSTSRAFAVRFRQAVTRCSRPRRASISGRGDPDRLGEEGVAFVLWDVADQHRVGDRAAERRDQRGRAAAIEPADPAEVSGIGGALARELEERIVPHDLERREVPLAAASSRTAATARSTTRASGSSADAPLMRAYGGRGSVSSIVRERAGEAILGLGLDLGDDVPRLGLGKDRKTQPRQVRDVVDQIAHVLGLERPARPVVMLQLLR